MPSVIGTDSLSGVNVAANYLKASPSSKFGTRQLMVISVAKTGIDTNYANADSLFSKLTRALQQTAEVYAVGTPAAGACQYIVAYDTQWAGDSASPQQGNTGQDGTGFGVLEAALNTGAGTSGVAVTEVTL